MTITDAMVEAAHNAYEAEERNGNGGTIADCLRAALEAACGEIIRENEDLRRHKTGWQGLQAGTADVVKQLERENEALQMRIAQIENYDIVREMEKLRRENEALRARLQSLIQAINIRRTMYGLDDDALPGIVEKAEKVLNHDHN